MYIGIKLFYFISVAYRVMSTLASGNGDPLGHVFGNQKLTYLMS